MTPSCKLCTKSVCATMCLRVKGDVAIEVSTPKRKNFQPPTWFLFQYSWKQKNKTRVKNFLHEVVSASPAWPRPWLMPSDVNFVVSAHLRRPESRICLLKQKLLTIETSADLSPHIHPVSHHATTIHEWTTVLPVTFFPERVFFPARSRFAAHLRKTFPSTYHN